MKCLRLQVDRGECLVRDFASDGARAMGQAAGHLQTLRRGRPRDQAHDRLVIPHWFATPIRRNEREQAVFDRVPFARPRREMANGNGQTRFIGQLLQFQFPRPQPPAVAAAANVRTLLQVQRNGDSGSPRAKSSTRPSSAGHRPRSLSIQTRGCAAPRGFSRLIFFTFRVWRRRVSIALRPIA